MRILFLSPRQCWPARGGAKLREYYFAQALAEGGELTYLYFSDPNLNGQGAEPLTRRDLPFCREIIAVPKPKQYSFVSLLQGVVGRLPLTVANYVSPEMSAAFEKALSARAYDLIHLESIHMITYGQSAIRGGHRVVNNWHNIESEAMRRYAATTASAGRRWYANLTASKLAACELDFLKTSFGNVVCSEREKEQLHQLVPSARIAVVENGVDAQGFTQSLLSHKRLSGKLIFVGLMDYYPNVEAVLSFSQRIWPRIREAFPEMSLWIVGANPTPAVAGLGALPGVTVTGTVPDVRPYYQDAEAAIVPLRTGGGTRLKILEAMAAGVPVISTPLGAEGLAVTPGKDILFAEVDNPEEWVRQLSALRENAAYRAQLVEQALELARGRYDWQILGRTLCETYQAWLQNDRLRNGG